MMNSVKARIRNISQGIVPDGYKQTRLGIIPETWDTPELNKLLTENKARNRNSLYSKNDVLSVSGEMGVTNQIDLLGRSFAGESVLEYHVVERGDVVYTKSPLKANPYGIIKQNKGEPGIVSTLYAVYHPKDYSVGAYLDYYFSLDRNVNNYLRPLVRKGTKNDMKINNEDALKGIVIFPSEKECTKILEILDCCDRVIRLKRELIEEKKKQKKSLMQKLLNPDSGFRLPGFNGEWDIVTLRDVCLSNGQYGMNAPAVFGQPDLPMYMRITDISDKEKYVNADDARVQTTECDKYLLHENDVVFVRTGGTVGKKYFYSLSDGKLVFAGFLIRFSIDKTKINVSFLKSVLNTSKYWKWVATMSQRSGQPGINAEEYGAYSFPIPTLNEQKEIGKILSSADHELDLLEQDLTQWEQKKQSLMQLLLTGKVRV